MTSAIAGSGRQMSNVVEMVVRTKLERSQSQNPDGERCCTVVVVFVMTWDSTSHHAEFTH